MNDVLYHVRKAKKGNQESMEKLVEYYEPLIEKHCKDVDNQIREDCRQYLITSMLLAVKKFKLIQCNCLN